MKRITTTGTFRFGSKKLTTASGPSHFNNILQATFDERDYIITR
ncbi:MAG: hypothetical protein ABI625_08915 [bacterium]